MHGRTLTSPVSAAACVALAFVAAACNRDSATTGPSNVQSKDFAANLRLVSGDQQLGPLGAALAQPIVVRVVDAGGQPVQGATVAFSVRSGGGSVNPAANLSDGNGLVSATWTMGTTLGAAKVVAILSNSFVLDSATFTATVTTGPASKFFKVSGDSQTTNASRTLTAPLVVKVQDNFGNNLSGVKVTWTPAASNGSVSFTSDTTAADGTASATWRLGNTAAAQALTAAITGAPSIAFSATATADTGRIMTVTTAPPTSGTVSTLLGTLTVRVTDQYGNVINGAAITWNDSIGGGGTLSANTGLTSAAGTASTTWTLGRRLGQQLIRAKLTGRTETVTATATATVGFSDVIAGNAMACGIAAATNAVYCWGAGNDGQLGKGGTTSSNAPSVAVAQTGDTLTGLILQARQVAGGRNGFCALTLARTLYCWGRQLGAASQPSPTAITLTGPGGAGVLPNAAFMGEDFGCLLTLAGSAFCGGNNLNGQLGNGGTPTGTTSGTWVSVTTPAGFTTFSSMATGRAHMCGIPRFNTASSAVTQAAYCWGQNSEGQVGDATVVDKGVVTIVTMPAAGTRFDSTTIATGAQHSCAVESANSVTAGGGPGTAWCWGGNGFGQLGTGDNARRTSPSLVLAPAGGAVAYARLYAGEHHTCGLTSAGAAYCWGRNDSGQLGNGTTTSSSTPVAVGGGPYRTLSLGENFTCGVTGTPGTSSQTAGTIFCWGNNQFGQLGIGNNTSVLSPASGRVSGQP